MKNKKIAVILSCIFIAAFILWANGCDSSLTGYDSYTMMCRGDNIAGKVLRPYAELRSDLEKRTGQSLEGWTYAELIELEKELLRLEQERKDAEYDAKHEAFMKKLREDADAERKDTAKDDESKLVEETSKEETTAYYEDDEEEDQATLEEKTIEEIQSSSDLPCQEIIGTWDGQMKMTRLTGTTTWTQHGESETIDVNELWAWWLEEPPDPLNILIWTENDQCFAKMSDYDADLTFQNGKIEWISVVDFQGVPIPYLFKGSLARPGMLQGTFEMPNPLGDEGAMIYGDWSASKTK